MLIGQDELYKKILDFKKAIYVEAPAGCGKTHSCIKCVNILSQNNKLKEFEKVLILTFSKNARAQIMNELAKYDRSEKIYKHIEISNYHSFYKKYLDKYRDVIGFKKEFTIVDDDEFKFIHGIESNHAIEFGDYYKLNDKYFSASKNLETNDPQIISNYKKYYEASRESGIITFNMFGILINELFEKSPKLIKLISHDYPYIFLDEYQDTDDLQEHFLIGLFECSKCVFFADPIQMIYDFKGASEKRLSRLKEIFPDIVEIKFEENFRYKSKLDIIAILENIRTGNILSYNGLTNGQVVNINIKLNNQSELRSTYGKNIQPSAVYFALLKSKIIQNAILNKKSICILVRSNELVNRLCLKFEENNFCCHEIADSKYMLKLNILLKKYLKANSTGETIKYLLQIYTLCKNNRRIEDLSYEKVGELTLNQFLNKRKQEFLNIKTITNSFQTENTSVSEKQKLIIEVVKLISAEHKNFAAYNFVSTVASLNNATDKIVDNIFTQKQYCSSYSKLNSGLYIANYHQCKGREFDEVIVVLEPSMENLIKHRNLLYVTHSRMKEKLFIAKYKFVGR